MTVRVIEVDLMLLNWSETANGGAKVVFQLADTADLEQFKSLTLAKGKRAGQLFTGALALIEEEVDPKWQKHGPAPRCKLVCQWCKTSDFQSWLSIEFPEVARSVSVNQLNGEAWAAQVVRALLGVTSRRDIDVDKEVSALFDAQIREPYAGFLRGTQ